MKIEIDRKDLETFNEFVGQIIDVFEDFLEDRGVELINNEKEPDDNTAIIYGTDYGELYSNLEQLLVNWSDKE